MELGTALQRAGTPSQRLEEALLGVSERIGLETQIFSTPTSLFASFGPAETQRTLLTRVEPAETNLERLVLLDELAGQVARGELSVAQGRRDIRSITARPMRYPAPLTPLLFATASACVGVFFGGSFRDVLAAGLTGLVLGLFLIVSVKRRDLARAMDFLSGFVAAAGAGALAQVFDDLNPATITIAGLIALVPGLTLTLAMGELAARHLVSGTARLMHALMILLAIGFGVALGRSLMPAPVPADIVPLPGWTLYAALAIVPAAFAMLFQARPSDWPVVAIAAWGGFFSSRAAADVLGPELGASVGAFTVGVISNLHARVRHRPTAIGSLPGIMLLVPGSLGLRTLDAMLADDAITGLDTAFSMILVAAGLVAGLLLANVAMPSRQSL